MISYVFAYPILGREASVVHLFSTLLVKYLEQDGSKRLTWDVEMGGDVSTKWNG